MIPDLTQVGVAGILVVLVLREVFGFLRARSGNGGGEMRLMARRLEDLHAWHAPDTTGRQDWKGMGEMTVQLRAIARDLREIVVELRRDRSA